MVGVRETGDLGELDAIYRPEKELQSIDQANPRFRFGVGRKWTLKTNVVVHKVVLFNHKMAILYFIWHILLCLSKKSRINKINVMYIWLVYIHFTLVEKEKKRTMSEQYTSFKPQLKLRGKRAVR